MPRALSWSAGLLTAQTQNIEYEHYTRTSHNNITHKNRIHKHQHYRLGRVSGAHSARALLSRVTCSLADRAAPSGHSLNYNRSQTLAGDLNQLPYADLADNAAAIASTRAQADVVLHLVATVSGWCEADFDLGMRSNADATGALLQMCRSVKIQPMVVFSSSLAVLGYSAAQPLPAVINDRTLPTPPNRCVVQEFIGEQLVADCDRKGFIRNRNVRLMTVSVRPGQPNKPGLAGGCLSATTRSFFERVP